MSDYKDFEVTVTYTGHITVSAIDEQEAEAIAREVMADENSPEVANFSIYKVRGF